MRHQRGFTLVEIVVVISIVVLVAALTWPVFRKAKAQALEASSISNMRQLHVAIGVYRSDYEGVEYGSMEDMGLPDAPSPQYLGPSVSTLRPPTMTSRGYYYYPVPSSIDHRNPPWKVYCPEHLGQTVLLADVWFNPVIGDPPYPYYFMDPLTTKYVIGITLDGNIKRKTAQGPLSLTWWDR